MKGLTVQQMRDMGYTETEPGVFRKTVAKTAQHIVNAPQSTPNATQSDSVVQKVSEHPKSPEDRLNKTEREFLGRLRSGVYGDFDEVGIQSITLQIGFDTRYTPDFWARRGQSLCFYEVKGFMRDDARVKLYAAARTFPFWSFYLVQKTKGIWGYKAIHQ